MMKNILDDLIKKGYQPIKRNRELEKVNPPNTSSHVKKSGNLIIDMNINFEQINEFLNKHKGDKSMTVIEEATMKSIQGIYKKLPDLNGVTLRDLFAMSALNGMYANDTYFTNTSYREVAEIAYKQADEMLEARKK